MEKFSLPGSFLIGFNHIDDGHQSLIDLLNDIVSSLSEGKLSEFEEVFADFMKRLQSHFNHEEAEMKKLKYHGLETHRGHHRICMARIEDLRDKCRAQGFLSDVDVIECYDCVINDIVRADLDFKNFVDSQ